MADGEQDIRIDAVPDTRAPDAGCPLGVVGNGWAPDAHPVDADAHPVDADAHPVDERRNPELVAVVGIRFRDAGKIYYFKPGDLELQPGDRVVVETARGIEFGTVVIGERRVSSDETVSPLREVIRKATPEDYAKMEENRRRAREAFGICEQKIAEHGLPMKLIDAEFTFDAGKVLFYFTAEGRVDFRELVKDLAAVFRTRIELRQIGVRDEAKMLGGLGPCGRELCCSTWLGDFVPVSIRMAKGQNLSLNPTKISGICGRLMCCLKYEDASYKGCPKAAEAAAEAAEYSGHPQGTGCRALTRGMGAEAEERRSQAPADGKPGPHLQDAIPEAASEVVFDEEDGPSEEGF
jgi:cell fate regulator YaaT (PSP1 superfamily)